MLRLQAGGVYNRFVSASANRGKRQTTDDDGLPHWIEKYVRALRKAVLLLWAVLICCVVIGSLLPSESPVMVVIGGLQINDKVLHFCAYLALSFLPVIGFRDRRRGIVAGLAMFVLGVLLEAGQQFSPGRTVELGDLLANGAGVGCGALLGLPIRTLFVLI